MSNIGEIVGPPYANGSPYVVYQLMGINGNVAHPVVPPRPVTAKEKKGSLFFCKRPTRLESGGEVGVETLAGGAKK